ncbi:MAG: hypothetical protein A49_00700 [Methyloceanibacter sp.]|nr:MAG: hypothetical protein A49_00700 [Methyloceanibacter sp.]
MRGQTSANESENREIQNARQKDTTRMSETQTSIRRVTVGESAAGEPVVVGDTDVPPIETR